LQAGNRRAKELGLTNCRFQEGDATNLHELEDKSFDLVVSIFGAMFAPKPHDVAKAMVRVTRPADASSWGTGFLATHAGRPNLEDQLRLHPATAGRLRQPDDVGCGEPCDRTIHGRGSFQRKDHFSRDTFTFNYPAPAGSLVDEFRKYYGPTMNAFDAAEKNGRAADLQKELEDLFTSQNKSPNKDATSIPATFLRVTVSL
jgi:SAM-dependent methyltransferase